jgi:hypothetical protein
MLDSTCRFVPGAVLATSLVAAAVLSACASSGGTQAAAAPAPAAQEPAASAPAPAVAPKAEPVAVAAAAPTQKVKPKPQPPQSAKQKAPPAAETAVPSASAADDTKASIAPPPPPPPPAAPVPPKDPNGPVITPAEPVSPRVAPPQKTVAPAVPATTPPTAAPGTDSPTGPIVLPPMIVQANAMAISQRALEAMKSLRTIDCITRTEQIGVPEQLRLSGLGLTRRAQLRFEHNDAVSMPLLRITQLTDTPAGVVEGPVAVFDGKKAMLIDDRDRTFVDPGEDWIAVVGPNLPAIPRWYLVERSNAVRTPEERKEAERFQTTVLGARILGTEELDGQLCDIVELYKSQPVFADTGGDGVGEIIDEIRFTDTIHYARGDGMPRRVQMRMLSGPKGDITPGETTIMHYSKVVINEGLEKEFFSAKPPAGYTRKYPQ